ncbi:MAG TPA: glycoside hydrolase family 3 [Candidatus Scatomorpha pullistercoris]|uniref:beta-N-acetylhexosaminidase n=1 Tax=Candidatus Scatomorpha pullistercoris TaxID=2840929 RepID=A0A9D1G7Q5_9FIRM|nr:glycoside hydrolase family 3 [Candidatus Scatomorpha pullistercoris]
MKKLERPALSLILVLCLMLSACGSASNTELPDPTAEPVPTATPEPTPTPDPVKTKAEALLADMSLHEKVCQLFVVRPEVLTGLSPVTVAGEATQQALENYPVGGLIYSVDNLVTQEQTREMIENTQSYSKIPLIISADEEGGNVGRLMYKLGTTFIHSMYSYKDEGPETAYQNALTIGTDMVSCLFNTDYAPVADVWTNPANTVIGDRAYSDDFEQAAELVASAVQGFTDAGVVCCLKHFPGHGDTDTDTHEGAAVVDKSLEELRAGELLPFISGIEAGADMVMIGHITVTALDEVPATISEAVISGLLREELGWDGVVITDSLDMGAMAGYDNGEVCVRFIEAGGDILLGVPDLAAAVSAVEAAVSEGRLTEQRLDESVQRILELKIEHGIIS